VFDNFNFDAWLDRLASANLLYLAVQKLAAIDVHPDRISNRQGRHDDQGLRPEEHHLRQQPERQPAPLPIFVTFLGE
jgi:hypothetical protein